MRTRASLVVLAAIPLFSAGCDGSSASGPVVYEAEYLTYESLDDLWDAADLVVTASTSQGPTVRRLDIEGSGKGEEAGEEGDVYTVFVVEVGHVWKGSASPGETLEVKQLGGLYEGVQYVEEGQATLSRDQNYVLFLVEFPDFPGVPASLLNPSQGQYRLDAGGELVPIGGNDLTVSIKALEELAEQG